MGQHFVTNASILLLCVFGHYLLLLRLWRVSPEEEEAGGLLRSGIATGLLFGVAGGFSIYYSVHLAGGVLLDLRNGAVMLAVLLGGPQGGMVAATITAVARLAKGGVYTASVIGVASSFCTAAVTAILVRRLPARKLGSWLAVYGASYLIVVATYAVVVPDHMLLFRTLGFYLIVSLPLVGLCYLLHSQLGKMKELYAEAKYNGDKYRQLFHGAYDLVYLFTVENGRPGRMLEANDTAAHALGYERRELLTISPREMYDLSHLDGAVCTTATSGHGERKAAAQREETKSGEGTEWLESAGRHFFEWNLKRKDGSFIPVEISGRMLRLSGQLVCLAVARDISLRKEAEQALLEANRKLERLSVSDGLTGIYNRRGMDFHYRIFWSKCLEEYTSLSVLLLDIDYFKAYNDTYGHLSGDQCLKRVALLLDTLATRAGGIACRYGGEEFSLVLPGAGADEACILADQIMDALASLALPHEGSPLGYVSLSIGIAAHIPAEEPSLQEELLIRADQALYQAKRRGRNKAVRWQT